MTLTTVPQPAQVVLFSGHMIDAADRRQPRFPPEAEPIAAAAIAAALDELRVGPDTLGMTEGSCGGDLLFAEALLARGAALELRLPFTLQTFIERSVAYPKRNSPADRWMERFQEVAAHRRVTVREMPDEGDRLPEAEDPYVQCNLWMLRDTLALGMARATIICLWNGAGGDGAGGTAHMMLSVEKAGGRVIWLDTRKLWSV